VLKQKYAAQFWVAHQVYLDLVKAKTWEQVDFKEDEQLGLYLTGRPESSHTKLSIVIPMLAHESLSMQQLVSMVQRLQRNEQTPTEHSEDEFKRIVNRTEEFFSVTLAILSADSSLVYYLIAPGLLPPLE